MTRIAQALPGPSGPAAKPVWFLLLGLLISTAGPAHADGEAEQRAQFCRVCHRPNYSVSYVPTLEGQTREYLFNQLKAFKEKRRDSEGHQRYWATLSDKDMRGVADLFASSAPVRASFDVNPQKVAIGRSKADALMCASCHMPDYAGRESIPRLAGLQPQYAAAQIAAFTAGKRQHPRIGSNSGISDEAEALGQYLAQVR